MMVQLATMAQPLLNFAPIKRTRRNHGLEHATVHMLSKRLKNTPMMGRSNDRGFVLFTSAAPADVEAAVREALQRMRKGEHSLAVHPGCGTSRLTTGFLVSMVAMAGLSGATLRSAFSRLPMLMVMMMFTILISEPLGASLQKHFTTEGDPGDLEILDISRREAHMPFSGQPITMYTIQTHST